MDDDPEMLSLLKMIFNGEGIDVLTAENGQVALNILDAEKNPQLILSDITMPVMSGSEFIIRLKKKDKTKNIPIILSSAMPNTTASIKTLGAAASLPKPYNLEKLMALVKTHLN